MHRQVLIQKSLRRNDLLHWLLWVSQNYLKNCIKIWQTLQNMNTVNEVTNHHKQVTNNCKVYLIVVSNILPRSHYILAALRWIYQILLTFLSINTFTPYNDFLPILKWKHFQGKKWRKLKKIPSLDIAPNPRMKNYKQCLGIRVEN